MLGRMIVKEWKEKLGLFIFALAGFLFFGLAFSAYSQDKEALDLLMGTMTLVFIPIFSLLLGGSGFYAEFRDDAWAYLFSRPVKKWRIWLTKYISLLSMLVVVLLVFKLVVEFHPAVKASQPTFTIPLRFGEDISFLFLAYLLPLSLFTIAFSLSILSEKSHIVVFLAALITYSLGVGLTYGPGLMALLRSQFWSLPGLSWLTVVGPLIILSFGAASILTLSKADFSQPRRRAWAFTKFAAIFLAASLAFGAVWTYASLSLHRTLSIWAIETRSGQAYFTTDSGIYRFDTATGRKDRLARAPHIWSVSLGGDGQVVYTSISRGPRASQDMWIIDGHGKKPRPLIRAADAGSLFSEGYIPPVRISPGGDKVAFTVWGLSGATAKNLWCVKTDGTGLKGCSVDFPRGADLVLGFSDSSRSVLILASPGGKKARQEGKQFLRVDLERGTAETLAERIQYIQMQPGEGPGQEPRLVAYVDVDRDSSLSTLRLLDVVTLEKRDVYQADFIEGLRWSPAGDKLAFVTFVTGKAKIGVYSVAESRVLQVKEIQGYDLRWPDASLDWVLKDRLILRTQDKAGGSLSVLDGNLTEKRTLPLPFTTNSAFQVRGAGQYVFVVNTEKSQLWSVDLNTDKWRRIY